MRRDVMPRGTLGPLEGAFLAIIDGEPQCVIDMVEHLRPLLGSRIGSRTLYVIAQRLREDGLILTSPVRPHVHTITDKGRERLDATCAFWEALDLRERVGS